MCFSLAFLEHNYHLNDNDSDIIKLLLISACPSETHDCGSQGCSPDAIDLGLCPGARCLLLNDPDYPDYSTLGDGNSDCNDDSDEV